MVGLPPCHAQGIAQPFMTCICSALYFLYFVLGLLCCFGPPRKSCSARCPSKERKRGTCPCIRADFCDDRSRRDPKRPRSFLSCLAGLRCFRTHPSHVLRRRRSAMTLLAGEGPSTKLRWGSLGTLVRRVVSLAWLLTFHLCSVVSCSAAQIVGRLLCMLCYAQREPTNALLCDRCLRLLGKRLTSWCCNEPSKAQKEAVAHDPQGRVALVDSSTRWMFGSHRMADNVLV